MKEAKRLLRDNGVLLMCKDCGLKSGNAQLADT